MSDAQTELQNQVMEFIRDKFKDDSDLDTYSDIEMYKSKIEDYFSMLTEENKQQILDELIELLGDKINNEKYVAKMKKEDKTKENYYLIIYLMLFFAFLPVSILASLSVIFIYRYFIKTQKKENAKKGVEQINIKLDIIKHLAKLIQSSPTSQMKLTNSLEEQMNTLSDTVQKTKNQGKETNYEEIFEEIQKEPAVFKTAEYIAIETKVNAISDALIKSFPTDSTDISAKCLELNQYFYQFLNPETPLDEIMQEKVDSHLEASKEFIDLVYNQIISNDFNLLKSSTEWKTAILDQFTIVLTKMSELEQEIVNIYMKIFEEEFSILFGEEITEDKINTLNISEINQTLNESNPAVPKNTSKDITEQENPLEEENRVTEKDKVSEHINEVVKKAEKIKDLHYR